MSVKMRVLLILSMGLIVAPHAVTAQAAPFAYVANANSASVSVIDTATNTVIATIPVQVYPVGVAVRPDGSRVYVSNMNSDSVTVINAASNSVITHITVGDGPAGIAVKPDGTRVYVANWNSGTVSVINTSTNTIVITIPIGASLCGLVINPAGTRAYVTRHDTDEVYAINTANYTIIGGPIAVGDGPVAAAVNPAGTRVYVTNEFGNSVTVINTQNDNNTVVTTIPLSPYGSAPYSIVVNPAGTLAYVTLRNDDRVAVINTSTNTVTGVIPAGDAPTGIDINATGTRLYVPNYYSNNVSVLNAGNNTLIRNVTVGSNPYTLGRFIGPPPARATTTRISLSSGGIQGRGHSYQAAMSSNGRYIAFASDAPNLVGGDTNNVSDIFVRDRVTRLTTRVSIATSGAQGNGPSYNPAISADGRYVAFESEATNLVSGDTNNTSDIFVRDLWSKTTTRVSIANGAAGTEGNGASFDPSISADGRFVAYVSEATNLVAGDNNNALDVFVRDRTGSTTKRVSIATGAAGAPGNADSAHPCISGNGQFVAFISLSGNLVTGDTNNSFDVFVRDLTANTTSRVSIGTGAAGAQANRDSWQPFISNDGHYVVFASDATNLVGGDTNRVADIFLRDRTLNTTSRVSLDISNFQGDGPSYNPVISNDGRYVAFESYAALEALDFNNAPDIYVRDRTTSQTSLVSIATSTVRGNSDSLRPAMSTDGRYVAFESFATNLVNGDNNTSWDIFVRDRGVGTSPPYPLIYPSEAMSEVEEIEATGDVQGTEEMKEPEEAEQP